MNLRAIAKKIATVVIFALCPHAPRVYNRSKWTGCLDSFNDICLLICCHFIIHAAYYHWMMRRGDVTATHRRWREECAVATYDGPGHLHVQDEKLAEDAQPSDTPLQAQDKEKSPEQNRTYRLSGIKFILQMHVMVVPLLRIVVFPLQAMLRSYMKISGKQWEVRQRAKASKTHGQPFNLHQPLTRDYKIVIAASNRYESKLLEASTELLTSETPWQVLHPNSCTQYVSTLAFRLTHRGMAITPTRFW